ncbi:hypothetical protein [Niveibacterium terrae]|uniref:hypothetical protein n=1 Tax=Niveibacterium terrae TaxID=3373598 RepID=UPI003A9095BB
MAENPWFRLYAEFATDPKVQMLSEVNQRRYIMLLCLRCSNGDVTLHDEEVAFQLRISNEEWAATKAVLVAKGLIGEDGLPSAWDRRQYRSDSSAERVRKHRENKKRACNVTVTAPDTDTDTEVNQKQTVAPDGAQVAAAPEHSDGEPEQQTGAETVSPAEPKAKTVGVKALVAEGVDRKVAEDWILVRKQKRSPLTETAWAATKSEIAKAGLSVGEGVRICAERVWVGFRADWLRNSAHSAAQPSRSAPRSMHDIPKDFSRYPTSTGITIDPNDKFEDIPL